jgi:hypothetical protein
MASPKPVGCDELEAAIEQFIEAANTELQE